MSRTLAIRPILDRMVDQRAICSASVVSVARTFGENPKITKANLRKAVAYSSLMNYRNFCAEWLGWPDEVRKFLYGMEGNILWSPTKAYRLKNFTERRRLVREAHVAATLAWIKEMRKP